MQTSSNKKLLLAGLLFSIQILSNAATVCHEEKITLRMHSFMKKYHIDGAAVVITNHGVTRTCLFGHADPARRIPVSENTLFEIGSITKTFTGLILAEHVLSGKLHLDTPIQNDTHSLYSPALGKVSLLQLATFTSGLPFNAEGLVYNASASLNNRNKLRNYLNKVALLFQPGSHMFYSNIGYGILGQYLANKEGVTLPVLMRRAILAPLDMKSSGLDISRENRKNLAQGYTAQGKPVPYVPSGLFGGSWAMRASVKDMQRYLQAVAGEQSTPATIRQAMRLAQTAYYDLTDEGTQLGLGWIISPLDKPATIRKLTQQPAHYNFAAYQVKKIKTPMFNANALIGKTGTTDGFRAYIATIPSKQTGIMIMINRFIPSSGALTNLANGILLQESHIS